MNKETALNRGYETTGIYEWSKAEVEPRCAAIRAEGYKALVVFVPSNPLSRGHRSGGYAVVVEPRYNKDKVAAHQRQVVSGFQAKCEAIKARHAEALAKEIAEETARMEQAAAWLTSNNY
jgi:hypothetical protein